MTSKRLAEKNDIKTDVKVLKDTDINHTGQSSYTRERRRFLAPVSHMEIPVGYARNENTNSQKVGLLY